jgi:spore maturation protein A
MCTFLILNISSLQLISVNMIAYRSQYGSLNPTDTIGPSIVATLCSTVVAMVYCKLKDRKKDRIQMDSEPRARWLKVGKWR